MRTTVVITENVIEVGGARQSLVAATSVGHQGGESSYLDARFVAFQPEYEAMLRGVGIQPGWQALDAGCGGGSHLPLLSTLVGLYGDLHALDLAPENIAAVERKARSGQLHCPLYTHTGSVLAIPLPDHSVHAVWNANVSQYLTDAELRTMLHEFRRVTRPGGIVAIKEINAARFQIDPLPPALFRRLWDAGMRNGVTQIQGALRTPRLGQELRAAGFTHITITSTPILRRAPLRPVERTSFHDVLQLLVHFAVAAELPAAELRQWHRYADAGAPTYILDHPDLCWRETQTVITGRVPGAVGV